MFSETIQHVKSWVYNNISIFLFLLQTKPRLLIVWLPLVTYSSRREQDVRRGVQRGHRTVPTSPGPVAVVLSNWCPGTAMNMLCECCMCESITGATLLGWGLLSKIHVKFHVRLQGFSNIASDWLVAVLPANQMPGLKILTNMDFNMEISLWLSPTKFPSLDFCWYSSW